MAHNTYPTPQRSPQKSYFFGAVLAVLLIGALMLWAAELITRDVSGVPVIKASASPLRSEPKDRNVAKPMYSELTINDVINPTDAASQAATGVRIIEEDISLQEEDLVPLDISLEAKAQLDLLTQNSEENGEFETGLEFQEGEAQTAQASSDGTRRVDVPLSQEVSDGVAAALQEVLAVDAARNNGQAQGGDIVVSLRAPDNTSAPKLRPNQISTNDSSTVTFRVASEALAQSMQQEIPASDVKDDAYVVQLIAMQTPQEARAKWDEIVSQSPSYFEGKSRVISQTQRNGQTLFRLRVAGFDGASDANAFCAALEQTGQDCLVTQMR